jgi:hypothetical protein
MRDLGLGVVINRMIALLSHKAAYYVFGKLKFEFLAVSLRRQPDKVFFKKPFKHIF